jgi:hypothetical protein
MAQFRIECRKINAAGGDAGRIAARPQPRLAAKTDLTAVDLPGMTEWIDMFW